MVGNGCTVIHVCPPTFLLIFQMYFIHVLFIHVYGILKRYGTYNEIRYTRQVFLFGPLVILVYLTFCV